MDPSVHRQSVPVISRTSPLPFQTGTIEIRWSGKVRWLNAAHEHELTHGLLQKKPVSQLKTVHRLNRVLYLCNGVLGMLDAASVEVSPSI